MWKIQGYFYKLSTVRMDNWRCTPKDRNQTPYWVGTWPEFCAGSDWEVLMCQGCGSRGIHAKCANLQVRHTALRCTCTVPCLAVFSRPMPNSTVSWEGLVISCSDNCWKRITICLSCQCGSGSSIFGQSDPDPGLWWPKIKKKITADKTYIFWSKNCN
jgi:hypothetical protein